MKKIALNSFGRFHTFDLAQVLNKHNLLEVFITSYPSYKFKLENVKSYRYIRYQILFSLLLRLKFYKLAKKYEKISIKAYSLKSSYVDYKNVEYIHCLSSFALETFKKYKNQKILLLDRGSTHRLHQENVLKNEYLKFNLKYDIDNELVERDLIEYELADKIIVPTNFVKNTFIDNNINKNKIDVMPYAMDSNLFFRNLSYRNNNHFLYIGALSIRKGVYYLIKAFNMLPDYNLTIVGAYTDEFEIIKKYLGKIEKNISFLGLKRRNQLNDYLNRCSALILPSIEEGLPLVILQAILCRTPIIVTNQCGHNTLGEVPNSYIIKPCENSIIQEILNFKNKVYINNYSNIINTIDCHKPDYEKRILRLYQ